MAVIPFYNAYDILFGCIEREMINFIAELRRTTQLFIHDLRKEYHQHERIIRQTLEKLMK